MNNDEKFFPITFRRRDARKLFSISERTFDRLVQSGDIHPILIDSLKLYKTSDILAYFEKKEIS
ncbi:hypothetical protein Q757_00170 [Oenococcus alcoholitolerans]|uniref:DNA-binding protein n=1 Tax=Oenococcus alcoholitolerans TaxID=931074 RepID=A0ABR4XT92_9LACO|nr:hypothetical protein Q757_00170 [Oenococcus alcoholitolerans]